MSQPVGGEQVYRELLKVANAAETRDGLPSTAPRVSAEPPPVKVTGLSLPEVYGEAPPYSVTKVRPYGASTWSTGRK
jgi:hypothetical protein